MGGKSGFGGTFGVSLVSVEDKLCIDPLQLLFPKENNQIIGNIKANLKLFHNMCNMQNKMFVLFLFCFVVLVVGGFFCFFLKRQNT